ncbi:MAG: hypothetical protein KAI66_26900, partial [Lentisphaeria bacterium]|nr:hypothetical protein [Lentisphaeria bacterium]
MTSRQRLLAAYNHQPVDRIPCSPRVAAWMREYYGDSGLPTKLRMADEFGFDPHANISVFSHPVGLTPSVNFNLPKVEISAIDEGFDGDLHVVRRVFKTPAGTLTDVTKIPPAGDRSFGMSPNPFRTEFLVKEPGDLEALRYLMPKQDTVSLELYFATERLFGERGLIALNIMSPLCHRAGDVLSMENLMIAYYEDRAFFDALLAMFHEEMMAEIEHAIQGGVVHFFANWYYNSMSSGWSPTIWREAFAPQLTAMCERIHAAGGTVNFYDDGAFMPIAELLADTGIDVLQTLTPPPVGDTDLAKLKDTIGDRVCLMGYVDLIYVLQRGTPELIDQTVKEAIDIAGPTGFILGSSDSFRDGTPVENIQAYFDA